MSYCIYRFLSLDGNLPPAFVATSKDIKTLINNQNPDYSGLNKILNSTYIYQLVFLNIEKYKINDLINTVNNNNIKLNIAITNATQQLKYINRKKTGYNNELELQPIINNVFGLNIIKVDYQYSPFDFYSENVLVEIKSLENIFGYVFVGTNKIICENMLFIFKNNTKLDLYYLQYDKMIFNTFQIIAPKMEMKQSLSNVYKIPIQYLTMFYGNDKIELIFNNDERETINELVNILLTKV